MATKTTKVQMSVKKEAFATALVLGTYNTATEAYIAIYSPTTTNKNTIWPNVSRLIADPYVSKRVNEMRLEAQQKTTDLLAYGTLDALQEIHAAYLLAEKQQDPGNMVRAVEGKAKLLGLHTDPRKNERTPLRDMNDADLDKFIADKAVQAGVELTNMTKH